MNDEADNLQDVGFIRDIVSYIFDEKKIVTYKWISNELNVHINKAKQLLYTFIHHLPVERLQQLRVTYLVGGVLPDNRGCRFQVVSEDDLSKVKEQFKIVTSEHVYSVSLKKCLSDIHDLYSADAVRNNDLTRHGALRCEQSIIRDANELAANRKSAQVTINDGKQWPADKPKESATAENKKKKPSNISAMFAASNNKKKTEESSAPKKSEEEAKQESVSVAVKKGPGVKGAQKGSKAAGGGRLAAMFSAQGSKPKAAKKDDPEEKIEKMEIKEEDTKEKKSSVKVSSKSGLFEEKKKIEKQCKEEKPKNSEVKKSQNSKTKQKKRKASEKKEEKNKKRKRIVVIEDSDSSEDDVFGSDDDEEEDIDRGRCPSPSMDIDETETETDPEKTKEEQPEAMQEDMPKRGHARKRVVVNKTFMDEEGYIVSKKVVEMVSCSEDEEEKENEKEKEKGKEKKTERKSEQKGQKSSPKKTSPPEKKKQATLMSFFKRN